MTLRVVGRPDEPHRIVVALTPHAYEVLNHARMAAHIGAGPMTVAAFCGLLLEADAQEMDLPAVARALADQRRPGGGGQDNGQDSGTGL